MNDIKRLYLNWCKWRDLESAVADLGTLSEAGPGLLTALAEEVSSHADELLMAIRGLSGSDEQLDLTLAELQDAGT